MAFIIIETNGGAACVIIVTDPDGINLVFDTREEAEQGVADCQYGVIVEL